MSTFMELAKKRQSTRGFCDKPIEHEKLVSCVEAGRLAPSACNSQPWSFAVAESDEAVAAVAAAAQQMGMNPFTSGAKAFIVIIEEFAVLNPGIRKIVDSQYFAKADVGAATAYINLEAAAQGLGICQIGVFDREAVCNALGLPQDKRLAALLAIGYPADEKIRDKIRKPLEQIASFK